MNRLSSWSAVNIAFGTGGALMQKINRDTQKCAFKCSSITVDGVEVSIPDFRQLNFGFYEVKQINHTILI